MDKLGSNAFHIINSDTWSLVGNLTLNICGSDEYDDHVKRTNVDIFTMGNKIREQKEAPLLPLPHPPASSCHQKQEKNSIQ